MHHPTPSAADWRPIDPPNQFLTNNEQPAVRPLNSNDNRLQTWSREWRFPQTDIGAFSFRVLRTTNSGLVIGLQNSAVDAESWATSGGGYAIVLDNCGTSWVGKLPYYDKEMPGTRRFPCARRLQSGERIEITVNNGRITARSGAETLVDVADRVPVPGVRYFGFGIFGQTLGQPKLKDSDELVGDVKISG